ncbi:hypothetical protein Vadar_024944 [Vaccinium darrowii]|uniref:Uncharacterized protein n=1 Tax=Vaccinium darrowii TaxID=229202 RepID=A0ACB7X3Q0_9ERIC|nr:hypothetical protein Vadar_024944 [Vaccinium darrowii]
MGNTCRGSFGAKNFQGYSQPEDQSISKHNTSSSHSNNSDISPTSFNSQQIVSQEFSKDNPKKTNDTSNPPLVTSSKDCIMKRSNDNQAYYVLGHKTANIRDLYTLGRKLGQGQFGTTYLCTEISTCIDYACKSISKRKLIAKEDVEDVRREIQIMHHLAGHKNIVTIKGAYEDPLYVHIVMELCGGGELFDRIIQRGHYSERKAAELTKIIVGVVEACHSLGVMHRDLKPENFLLVNKDDDFSLKAIDFGLSVFFKPGQVFTDVVGSPYYVAPEVLLKHYGPEADVWTAGVILYILLSGVPPFWAETQQGIFDAVLKGHIDFASDPWPLISDSAKDLIQKMLCSRPSERLTAHEVMCHPWICKNGVAPDRALDPAVLSRLKQFSAMNKLKKMALRVIAESLSEEEIAGLREMFKAMDTDNSGAITFDELKAGLRRYGSTLKDTEIRDLMDAADVDNSGTIDYGEFVAATVHLNKLEREEHLVAAFQYFDKDGSGYITVDELQQACVEHNMTDVFLEDIIREVDQDNDGRIDYQEFSLTGKEGREPICGVSPALMCAHSHLRFEGDDWKRESREGRDLEGEPRKLKAADLPQWSFEKLKIRLSEIQWAAFILLCAGCTTAQLNPSSDRVLQTPFQGWVMAIVMALLSGFAGVYTEAIIKKRPSRNINVQNFWLYVFGMGFKAIAILVQDFNAVMNRGFFHGYSLITTLMIINHALSGMAVSMVMKYADNIVKVYSTSVAMLLTDAVCVFLFGFHRSLPFFLGSTVVFVSIYLHSIRKDQEQLELVNSSPSYMVEFSFSISSSFSPKFTMEGCKHNKREYTSARVMAKRFSADERRSKVQNLQVRNSGSVIPYAAKSCATAK